MATSSTSASTFDPLEVLDSPEVRAFVFHPRRALGPGRGGEWVFFEASDGVKIGCKFWGEGGNAPLILYFHGNGEIVTDYDDIAPEYLRRGLQLLVADYRGYGLSEGEPTLRAVLEDAHEVFRGLRGWLLQRGWSPPLFVMGRSLGGLPAVEIAKAHQGELKGLILESTSATNFRSLLAEFGLLPWDHPMWEEGRGFFNWEKIREIALPTLIIHAERDSLIPLQEAEKLYREASSPEKRLVVIPGADHNDLMFRDPDLYYGSIEGFVKEVSGGPLPDQAR